MESTLEENSAAASIRLTAEELARIDAVAPNCVAAGDRRAGAGMRSVNL